MENLLDSILNAGPVIIGENHDTSKIDWRAGMGDAAEMLKMSRAAAVKLAKEEGISVESATEKLGQAAGLRRASLDVTNGRVSLIVAVGLNGEKLPWHKLGVHVAEAVNSADAARLSGLAAQTISKLALSYVHNGAVIESKKTFALVRDDTGAQLGECGTGYKVIQNSDGFAVLDSLLAEFGAKYESAGSLFGGREAFMVARMPEGFEFPGADRNDTYAMFTLDHSGAGADNCFATATRAVCANTKRLALRDKQKGFSIRHTGDVQAKIADARKALGLTVIRAAEYKESAETMFRTAVNVPEFIGSVLDACLEVTGAQSKQGADILAAAIAKTDEERDQLAKRFAKQIERRENILEDILARHESATTPAPSRGTLWGAVNAITESSDFARPWRRFNGDEAESRRFESAITGPSDDVKEIAFVQARALMMAN